MPVKKIPIERTDLFARYIRCHYMLPILKMSKSLQLDHTTLKTSTTSASPEHLKGYSVSLIRPGRSRDLPIMLRRS